MSVFSEQPRKAVVSPNNIKHMMCYPFRIVDEYRNASVGFASTKDQAQSIADQYNASGEVDCD